MNSDFLNEKISPSGKKEVVWLLCSSIICAIASVVVKIGFKWLDYYVNYLYYVIILAPSILLLFYILKCQEKLKQTALVPIAFSLAGYAICDGSWVSGINLGVVVWIAFVVMVIGALKGLENKKLIWIPSIIVLLVKLVVFVYRLSYGYAIVEILYIFLNLISSIAICLAFLLFGLKNRIPRLIVKKEKVKAEETLEDELMLLQEKFELGMLTEEEYKEKRAEIISKL